MAANMLRLLSTRGVSSPAKDAPFRHIRMAAIVDEFTAVSFGPEVQLLNLDSRTWPVQLARFRPDLLFVESAWRGHAGTWRRKIASYPNRRRSLRLRALRRACRALGIPTVFWNKEDPVHYDRFLYAARGFDYVFTTAIEKVPDYQRELGLPSTHVAALPFGFQPRIYHPPPAAQPRDDRVIFAGSYGESHFPERRRQLEMLLDGALAAGANLVIYDRTADEPVADKMFPERFRPYIRGALDYRALADVYRTARAGLNVNAVTDSETMFSRRVFEMLACGLPVISGPSIGIETMLADQVAVVTSIAEAEGAIGRNTSSASLGEDHRMVARLQTVVSVVGL